MHVYSDTMYYLDTSFIAPAFIREAASIAAEMGSESNRASRWGRHT
jgi:predicted nucleic acid-binding protein